ncbi:hypothetical protein CQA09_29215, partial [Klebsiella pneumoniae]
RLRQQQKPRLKTGKERKQRPETTIISIGIPSSSRAVKGGPGGTEEVKRRDQETATAAKAKIEDRQREETAARNNDNIDWHPQLF